MFRSPSQAGLPGINVMLADLPGNHKQAAQHLGITLQTLKKYVKADGAPRAVMLAIFWETRWGRSAADTEAANWGAMYYRQAKGFEREAETLKKSLANLEQELRAGLEREVDALKKHIFLLEKELQFAGSGASNSPIFRVA